MAGFGTPRITIHLEAKTDECICDRLVGCGGIEESQLTCPEHGADVAIVSYHTHAVQVSKVAPGIRSYRLGDELRGRAVV